MNDPGDARKTSRLVVAGIVILAVVTATLVLVVVAPHQQAPRREPLTGSATRHTSGAPGMADQSNRDADALSVLARQDRVLRRGSLQGYLDTWDRSRPAQRQARAIFVNLRGLGVSTLNARYVAANGGSNWTLPSQQQPGEGAWSADVEIAWRSAGSDRAEARSTLSYTFAEQAGQVRVVAITAGPHRRTPIWLLGRLHVKRTAHTMAAAMTEGGARRVDADLRRAVVDVRRVLPSWHGDLVAYVPATDRQFESLLASSPGAYARIAAVTTTADGSRRADAPVAIVVNPRVFGSLGPIGAHVVITHESTHVATGATTVRMPLWVAEGFADYVGVGSVDVPLAVSARAAVRDVRRHGLPRSLPGDSEFAGSSIEVAYEQAWLAMRVIARAYGRDRLVAFYDDVVRRPYAVGSAVRENLGTSLAALTREWRAYLQGLADER